SPTTAAAQTRHPPPSAETAAPPAATRPEQQPEANRGRTSPPAAPAPPATPGTQAPDPLSNSIELGIRLRGTSRTRNPGTAPEEAVRAHQAAPLQHRHRQPGHLPVGEPAVRPRSQPKIPLRLRLRVIQRPDTQRPPARPIPLPRGVL